MSYCQQQSHEVNTGSAMFYRIYMVQQPARTPPIEQAPVSLGQFVSCFLRGRSEHPLHPCGIL